MQIPDELAKTVLDCSLYLLALMNPVSKVFILSTFSQDEARGEMRSISVRSSGIALLMLLVFAGVGNFILDDIFHVDLFSLKVAGGIVLFMMGYRALSKGLFFEIDITNKLSDLSIVPLASPMIAGPATLTATISFTSEFGTLATALATCVAVGVNLVVMLLAEPISRFLKRFNLMGALIRITGLIVATIAVQMVFSGVAMFNDAQTAGDVQGAVIEAPAPPAVPPPASP